MDLYQIKIEEAKSKLSEESRQAIDAVPWKTVILAMRAEKGYSFTQLEDMEIETELLLCGLVEPRDYPKELRERMNISPAQADELVNEMNEKVFKKIREELVKIVERKKMFEDKDKMEEKEEEGEIKTEEPPKPNMSRTVLDRGESQPQEEADSILARKLSGTFQIPAVQTEHSLPNIARGSGEERIKIPNADPYRMPIE